MGMIDVTYHGGFGGRTSTGKLEISADGVSFRVGRQKKPVVAIPWSQVRCVSFDDPGRTKANVGNIVLFGVLGLASRRAFSLVTVTTTGGAGYFESAFPLGTWRGLAPQILAEVPQSAGKIALDGEIVGAQTSGAEQPSEISLLQQLANLHDQGVLNDEEFAAKKRELLDRI